MTESLSIIIIAIVIFYLVAELFGRSNHIGRWWSFFLLLSGLIPGIIAIIASPSAKNKPTQGGKSYNFFGWIFYIFGWVSVIALFGSNGEMGQLFFAFFIIGFYLFRLSNGKIINNNPKYYFDNSSTAKPIFTNQTIDYLPIPSTNIKQIKSNLSELNKSGVLSNLEYDLKLKKIEDEEIQHEILNSDEYLKLKNLLDVGVLNKIEFNNKVEIISTKYIASKKEKDNIKIIKEGNDEAILINEKRIIFSSKFIDSHHSFKNGSYKSWILRFENNKTFNYYTKNANYFISQNNKLKFFIDKKELVVYALDNL